MITPVGRVAALVLGFVGGGPGLLPVVPWAGLIREPPAPRAAGSGQRASLGDVRPAILSHLLGNIQAPC